MIGIYKCQFIEAAHELGYGEAYKQCGFEEEGKDEMTRTQHPLLFFICFMGVVIALSMDIAAIGLALFSACYWFQSAALHTPETFHIYVNYADSTTTNPGDSGLVARSPQMNELGASLIQQSKLNAKAAYLIGESILLGLASRLLFYCVASLRKATTKS